jgi:hypothetical protein
MAQIINLTNENARLINDFKKSVAYMQTVNSGGRYSDQIDIEKKAIRYFMDDILGVEAA